VETTFVEASRKASSLLLGEDEEGVGRRLASRSAAAKSGFAFKSTSTRPALRTLLASSSAAFIPSPMTCSSPFAAAVSTEGG